MPREKRLARAKRLVSDFLGGLALGASLGIFCAVGLLQALDKFAANRSRRVQRNENEKGR